MPLWGKLYIAVLNVLVILNVKFWEKEMLIEYAVNNGTSKCFYRNLLHVQQADKKFGSLYK